jgi:hypothetical protein
VVIELISVQELCDRTGLPPARLRRLHDQLSRVPEDPFPAFLYEYKTTVIVDKVATVDWLERLYADMVKRLEAQVQEAKEFLDSFGDPEHAHLSSRLGFGKERQRALKRVRDARAVVSKAPKALESDGKILAALRGMYEEMGE